MFQIGKRMKRAGGPSSPRLKAGASGPKYLVMGDPVNRRPLQGIEGTEEATMPGELDALSPIGYVVRTGPPPEKENF